jgi:hypothetical protein
VVTPVRVKAEEVDLHSDDVQEVEDVTQAAGNNDDWSGGGGVSVSGGRDTSGGDEGGSAAVVGGVVGVSDYTPCKNPDMVTNR